MLNITLSPEYKLECVELVIVHVYKYKDTGAAMYVGLSSIQHWVSQYRKE